MLNGIKSILMPTSEIIEPRNAGYQAIRGDSDEGNDHHDVVDETVAEKGDKGSVYFAFWSLGAGVLLSWNGRFSAQ
jgi:hypothetical protein